MRICLFGEGRLQEAVREALQGHDLVGPFVSPQSAEVLTATQADVGLSAGYRHKLTAAEWGCFPNGILNLHTSYLPWNRGAYPNVWSILDGSPAGVTLHRVDAGWDTGPIIAQRRVPVEPWDTAGTLYEKLIATGAELVAGQVYRADSFGWPDGIPQLAGEGSRHTKAEWEQHATFFTNGINRFSADESWTLNALRAASFPGYGLRYRQDGKLLEATISIREVQE